MGVCEFYIYTDQREELLLCLKFEKQLEKLYANGASIHISTFEALVEGQRGVKHDCYVTPRMATMMSKGLPLFRALCCMLQFPKEEGRRTQSFFRVRACQAYQWRGVPDQDFCLSCNFHGGTLARLACIFVNFGQLKS